MKKRTTKPKKAPKQDQASFERKVAELGSRLNKLPAARQEQLEREQAGASKGPRGSAISDFGKPIHVDDILESREAFELAMLRVKDQNKKQGIEMTFRQLLDEAQEEVKREHARLKARIAQLPPESD